MCTIYFKLLKKFKFTLSVAKVWNKTKEKQKDKKRKKRKTEIGILKNSVLSKDIKWTDNFYPCFYIFQAEIIKYKN